MFEIVNFIEVDFTAFEIISLIDFLMNFLTVKFLSEKILQEVAGDSPKKSQEVCRKSLWLESGCRSPMMVAGESRDSEGIVRNNKKCR